MNNYKGKIRKGVLNGRGGLTTEFSEFIEKCKGVVEVKNKEYNNVSILDEIHFTYEEDLVLYLLTFDEVDVNKVILPVIRRVMPTLIANEIIGVQPMNGPTAHIHTLHVKYK